MIDESTAWSLLGRIKTLVREAPDTWPIQVDAHGVRVAAARDACLTIYDSSWNAADITDAARELLDLYMPVCRARPGRPITVAHLGQSLDGRIATQSGASHYITGPENILHLHRMRALSDAIVVGAQTVVLDDPRLTTRKVSGGNPSRVIIDPHGRIADDSKVLVDGAAPTIVVRDQASSRLDDCRAGRADILPIPATDGQLDIAALLDGLHARGLWSVFVEGGGATVSDFLRARVLDRLQLAIAPLIIGSGIHGLSLPEIDDLGAALRPDCRVVQMGNDILFDCRLAQ